MQGPERLKGLQLFEPFIGEDIPVTAGCTMAVPLSTSPTNDLISSAVVGEGHSMFNPISLSPVSMEFSEVTCPRIWRETLGVALYSSGRLGGWSWFSLCVEALPFTLVPIANTSQIFSRDLNW